MKNAKNNQTELPETLNKFFGQDSIERTANLYEAMQRPIMMGVDFEIHLPLLGHWVKIFSEKTKGNKRKRYSFTEFVWFKLVEQLRNAGLDFPSLKKLKSAVLKPIKIPDTNSKLQKAKKLLSELKATKNEKEELLNLLSFNEVKNSSTEITILNAMIVESLINKSPLSIAAFLDGSFIVINKDKEHLFTETDKNKLAFDTHIVVSITKLLEKFLSSDSAGFIVPEISLLSPIENKLFEFIYNKQYNSIIINYKDKKNKSLELKKNEDAKKRIIEILNRGVISEIIVKSIKGEIIKYENTNKLLL